MSRILLAVAVALAAAEVSVAPAQQPGAAGTEKRSSGAGLAALPAQISAPASRVMTDDELRALRSAQYGGKDGLTAAPPKKRAFDFAAMSVFLANAGKSAALPKGCILWAPENLKARVSSAPSGDLVPWVDFITANRGWVGACEVDLKQVRGEKPLPDSMTQAFKARGMVIVATLNGNPVTVLPYSAANAAGAAVVQPASQPTSTPSLRR